LQGGNRQLAGVAPALNESDRLLAGSVGLEDLGKPGPEHRQMPKAALALCGVDGGKEVARKDVIEENRIPTQGAPADDGGGLADRGLQTALGGGENSERKVVRKGCLGTLPNRTRADFLSIDFQRNTV